MAYVDYTQSDILPERFKSVFKVVFEWLPLLIVILLWELASGWVVSETVLSPPSVVMERTWELTVTGDIIFGIVGGEILPHIAVSLWRVAWGLGLGILVGIALAIGMARITLIKEIFDVPIALLYPVPKVAFIPLAILVLGVGNQTAILIIFLACLLPIIMNVYNAARNVDQELIWSARMMGTSERMILWKIVIPDTVPEIITGIRQSIPIAFIALVSVELIASSEGIGFFILRRGQVGDQVGLFAAVVVIVAVAYTTVRLFEWFQHRVVVWT